MAADETARQEIATQLTETLFVEAGAGTGKTTALVGRIGALVAAGVRMRGIAAWHVGDDASARAAFTALGKNAPLGRALEVERWLDRLGRGP